ncbi:hypothetical protein B0A49_01233 [Cryomyces minteri]|uniref:Uncharacterized protein n=1 Tax=Cryomyces minteri TaxID=331657 RepID=A0A4U0XP32_9PEZI|nr:hypothetical protein B0A49_01233 [Cryomyces minteri]
MKLDLEVFKKKVDELWGRFQKHSMSKRHIVARTRVFFSEDELAKYERMFSGHLDTATFMLNMLTDSRTRSMMLELKAQSLRVDGFISSAQAHYAFIESEVNEVRLSRLMCKEEQGIERRVTQKLLEIDTKDCDGGQQLALSYLRGIPRSESSLQVYHATERGRVEHHPRTQLALLGADLGDLISSHTGLEQRGACSWPSQVAYEEKMLSVPLRSHRKVRLPRGSSWQLSMHQFPIGMLTIATSSAEGEQDSADHEEKIGFWSIKLSLYPASWIANRVVQLSFDLYGCKIGAPSFTWNLKQSAYNQDPDLLQCLHSGNVSGLRKLFKDKRARATDVVAPWGNSLLHEVVYAFMAGRPSSLEICKFLLATGADLNCRNIKGRTPLVLCCYLMSEHQVEARLHEMASLLIGAGTDLAIPDHKGTSACSFIFQARTGLKFLQSFVYRFVDLFTVQQMDTPEAWLLAALARSTPTFQKCLEAEMRSYRCVPNLSSSRQPRSERIEQLDANLQVLEVQQAGPATRTSFLTSLSANGTLPMIAPFLQAGINLDESLSASHPSYACTAAKHGNIEVLMALLNAGASLSGQAQYPHGSTFQSYPVGAVDDLIERWFSLRIGRPGEYFGDPKAEYWVLPELLRNPTFSGPNVLYVAIRTRQPEHIYRTLLDAGCGRRDGVPPASWQQKVYGSEVIEAVKVNDPIISVFLEYGLALECEDRIGFTALLHALDRGNGALHYTKLLIEAGADLTRRTASGLTPIQFAQRNLNKQHPRMPRHNWTLRAWDLRPVSLEEDLEAYEMLVTALRERRQSAAVAWLAG